MSNSPTIFSLLIQGLHIQSTLPCKDNSYRTNFSKAWMNLATRVHAETYHLFWTIEGSNGSLDSTRVSTPRFSGHRNTTNRSDNSFFSLFLPSLPPAVVVRVEDAYDNRVCPLLFFYSLDIASYS